MWKRLAVLVVACFLPVSAVAHTKLYYRKSYTSDYRKIEMISTPELTLTPVPIEIPLVVIPQESTVTPEATPTSTPTEVPTSEPEAPDQITTPTDLSTTPQDLL